RLARFQREAEVLASLNHPHIAAIYGLEDGAGTPPVLVMELVEDDDLAERIKRGALPLDEALTLARLCADRRDAIVTHRGHAVATVRGPVPARYRRRGRRCGQLRHRI